VYNHARHALWQFPRIRHISATTRPNITEFSVHVACGRCGGRVLMIRPVLDDYRRRTRQPRGGVCDTLALLPRPWVGGVQSTVMSMSVCLFVCLSVRSQLENHMAKHQQILMHVVHGRGSFLLWRHCDTLYTSSFVDDVVFSHNVPKWR